MISDDEEDAKDLVEDIKDEVCERCDEHIRGKPIYGYGAKLNYFVPVDWLVDNCVPMLNYAKDTENWCSHEPDARAFAQTMIESGEMELDEKLAANVARSIRECKFELVSLERWAVWVLEQL